MDAEPRKLSIASTPPLTTMFVFSLFNSQVFRSSR